MTAFLKSAVLFISVFISTYAGLHLYFQAKYVEIFAFCAVSGFVAACFMTWIERRF